MFIIAVYDSPNSTTFRKILKKYLFWRQNSVFDGKLTRGDFEKVKNEVKNNITENDYIIFYAFKKIGTKGLEPEIIEYGKVREDNEFII